MASRGGQKKKTTICFICRQSGHYKRDCPLKKDASNTVRNGYTSENLQKDPLNSTTNTTKKDLSAENEKDVTKTIPKNTLNTAQTNTLNKGKESDFDTVADPVNVASSNEDGEIGEDDTGIKCTFTKPDETFFKRSITKPVSSSDNKNNTSAAMTYTDKDSKTKFHHQVFSKETTTIPNKLSSRYVVDNSWRTPSSAMKPSEIKMTPKKNMYAPVSQYKELPPPQPIILTANNNTKRKVVPSGFNNNKPKVNHRGFIGNNVQCIPKPERINSYSTRNDLLKTQKQNDDNSHHEVSLNSNGRNKELEEWEYSIFHNRQSTRSNSNQSFNNQRTDSFAERHQLDTQAYNPFMTELETRDRNRITKRDNDESFDERFGSGPHGLNRRTQRVIEGTQMETAGFVQRPHRENQGFNQRYEIDFQGFNHRNRRENESFDHGTSKESHVFNERSENNNHNNEFHEFLMDQNDRRDYSNPSSTGRNESSGKWDFRTKRFIGLKQENGQQRNQSNGNWNFRTTRINLKRAHNNEGNTRLKTGWGRGKVFFTDNRVMDEKYFSRIDDGDGIKCHRNDNNEFIDLF